jgi:LuxR family maltose regulon positive regulatory protein
MLRIAWALLTAGVAKSFETLLQELYAILEAKDEEDCGVCGWTCEEDRMKLLGEWTLLSSFLSFPHLDRMKEVLVQADSLFNGSCSKVILPVAPWCFGSYYPLAEFHITPGEADKEADALEKYISLYSKMTNGHGSGADVLFRGELAYQRGDLNNAEILSYKALFLAESRQQSVVQMGAAMLLAGIALHKADMTGWKNAVRSMEQAASYTLQNTFVVRSLLDIVRGVLLCELKSQENIADWIKKSKFSQRKLLNRMVGDALFVHASYLMHQGEFSRMIGTIQAMGLTLRQDKPFSDFLLSLLEAVGYLQLEQYDRAKMLVKHAAEIALPDGLIFPLSSYSWMLQGLTDELIAEAYPEYLEKYHVIKERFALGWEALHKGMFPDKLPLDLTSREYEVARLAAEGLRNSEIAERLVVSESTVRAHLRTIFQKLDIDRRAKLIERLK